MKIKSKLLKKHISILHLGIWLSIGILISMMIAGIYVSGNGNLKCFYNVGEVYDVPKNVCKISGNGWIHNAQTGKECISVQEAYKQINVSGKERNWNYCIIDISDMTKTSIRAIIECTNSAGTIVYREETELTEGRNWVAVGIKFVSFRIYIPDEVGVEFKLDDLQLRKQNPDDSFETILRYGSLVFGIYIGITLLILFLCRKKGIYFQINLDAWIDGLLSIYCKVANLFGKYTVNISQNIRQKIHESCFLFLIIYSTVIINCYQHLMWWETSQAIYTVVVVIIALFSIEREIKPLNWKKNRLIYAWMFFWILACISDFVVEKKFTGVGYVQILIWGFCFCVWGNMRYPHRILKAFMNAVHISFLGITLFCLFCRPELEGLRYLGAFINPNVFANYLVVVVAVILADMFEKLLHEEKKDIWYLILEYCVALCFLWKTQTRGAILAVILLGFLAAWYFVYVKKKQAYRKLSQLILCIVILMVPISGIISWCISVIPYKLDTVVVMEKDMYKPEEQYMGFLQMPQVLASGNQKEESAKPRVIQSLTRGSLEEISSGRTLYWKAYIRNMNLWGHKWKALINGERHDAHNAVLGIAHRYGIFSVIPYVLIWIYSVIYAGRYVKEHKYGFLPLALSVGYIIVALVDTEEQPYVNFIWFAVYFVIGILFTKRTENRED